MLIKEYRIPLPLTVEEYRVAQLYMIAKKSREETQGAGSGVEILVNEPYIDGPGGNGQYTHKIYHIGYHLPGWLKALLPKSALTVEEEAWNAYPYTKTRYTCPFVEKFSLEIETKYFNDAGHQENVFSLSSSDIRNRVVDLIDIVKDQLYGADYKKEEDPRFYVSEKTNRGPLSDNWIEEYWQACMDKEVPLPDGRAVMCAYKLCRVEFKYWGMQSKIEKFIHDVALRKTMLRAHRQAWAWQDEWVGLTMDDIRQLEKETQEALAKKMAGEHEDQDEEGEGDPAVGSIHASPSSLSGQEVDLNVIDKDKDLQMTTVLRTDLPKNRSPSPHRLSVSKPPDLPLVLQTEIVAPEMHSDGRQKLWSRSNSKATLHSPSGSSTKSFEIQIANWRMESIVRDSESSSEEEFFDAEDFETFTPLAKWSSMEIIPQEDRDLSEPDSAEPQDDSIFSSSYIQRMQNEHVLQGRPMNIAAMMSRGSIDTSLPPSPTASPAHQPCKITVLILVLHSGSILDSGAEPTSSKKSDVTTFRGAFENVLRQHYPSLLGHVAIRLVPCPAICSDALAVLSSLSPYSFQLSPSAIDGICHTYDAIPLGSLPLFAVSSPDYQECVSRVVSTSNQVYNEFLRSDDGQGFSGQVVLIGDSLGSILAYDALCRTSQLNSRYGSENSITEVDISQQPQSASTATSTSTGAATGTSPSTQLQTPPSPGIYPRANPLISISDGSGSGNEEADEAAEEKSKANSSARTYRKSHSHPPDSDSAIYDAVSYQRLLSAPPFRRRSSCSSDQSNHHRLDFEVSELFMFGSPLGLVMAYRKMLSFDDKNAPPPRPSCSQVYNLFHPTDPSVCRLEPLLSARFSHLPPVSVPRYQKYPLGDGQPTHLLTQKWWGSKRLDYALYCPEGLANFPSHALPHLFHASYWESTDVIAFITRQLLRADPLSIVGELEKEPAMFIPTQPREKWLKKRTSVKLKVSRNVTANHRANDVIVKEGAPQVLTARFMYGPLDMVALTGEKVDIHIMQDPRGGEWVHLSTEVTDKTGRVTYVIPKEKALGYGMFPVKFVVRGDHTSIDFFLTVIPPNTECVVFSIDGSFTASVSVTGRDPKVRAGAVDVVRHWQELGYLIIYITGRPDMQQQRVVSWLAQHNFPHGLVSFADKLSTDPLRHKAEYLKHLVSEAEIIVHAAYGSSKDIWVYSSIGLKPEQIFVVGKASKKQHSVATILDNGYAAHLSDLTAHGGSRPAQGNARMMLPRGCFGLPGQGGGGLRHRRSAKRTTSHPLSGQVPESRARAASAKTTS